jgi:fucose permease
LSGLTASQSLALFNAYWSAYFFAPLVAGYWVLTRYGFKPTFITGLGVYTVGTTAFWPSSVLLSFPGFFISNFFVALGSALLEVAANPFIALAGPEHLMEARLNFSQGFQGIGSVLSPILATRVLFKDVARLGLFNTQWTYLAVALWASLLGLCFYYVPLSEAPDEAIEAVARRRELAGKPHRWQRVWGCRILYLVTITAIFVMWLYVGVQEQLDYFWVALTQEAKPG